MGKDSVDEKKRRFLLAATATMGAVTAVSVAYPFLRSMWPSREVESAAKPVRVQVGQMKAGQQLTVIWRGRPVWIVRRDQSMLDGLSALDSILRDPNSNFLQQPVYARNAYRSISPDFLVVIGVCTHLGCVPSYRPEPGSIDAKWPGGFYCSCHGSRFDLAGRVYKGAPATLNMEVPPYYFANSTELVIGEDGPVKV